MSIDCVDFVHDAFVGSFWPTSIVAKLDLPLASY